MGKVKIKRKSTLIDMTAMSDVTVLLLTFFMLTSTFLQKEPVVVETPSSVQEQKVPTSNVTNILVSPTGEVFIAVTGEADPDASAIYAKEQNPNISDKEYLAEKGKWASDSIRKDIVKQVILDYAEAKGVSPASLNLSDADIAQFAKIGNFGMPIEDIKKFLSLSQVEQDQVFTKFASMTPEQKAAWNADRNNVRVGIPMPEAGKGLNEFQLWMRAIKKVAMRDYPNFDSAMKKGEGIAIKADKRTPFATIHPVLDNLQTIKMNKFTLMTALKSQDQ
ncbi:MAG: biopolymer transporter ExbD [Paramuribaculum sp.]|nr:biopolymer transporter ExbD [Paramuribaculum sp.]MDE6383709.1 biopolymer transporter ExbD [Paramuribaculum sp.]MDE6782715.1 biopolymer transporter ExbD [Paramuribaculum sp.]